MSAVISADGRCRYRLDRHIGAGRIVYAYFGVNGATADGDTDDHTVRKWNGFTRINLGLRYIVGNAFGHRAKDVRELALQDDPIGPDNDFYLAQIIAEADILVPCWGSRGKLPRRLRPRLDDVAAMLHASGKPIKIFGLTNSLDPLHPLTLGYDTPLIDWQQGQGIFG